MNWLIALLALAGVLAVLSTITTVMVEGAHKVFALRSGGLMRMLRTLHHLAIVEDEGPVSDPKLQHRRKESAGKKSKTFARDMVSIPTKRDTFLDRTASSIPVVRRLGLRFDRLTKLQFVEQMAQTEFGRKLAEKERAVIERTLAVLSYQFDRLGEAQSAVFAMRAKFLSSIAAFAFVVFANVSVIEVYTHLASNEETVAQTLRLVNATSAEGEETLDERLATFQQKLLDLEKKAAVDGGETVEARQTFEAEVQDLRESLGVVRNELTTLTKAGLPIGRAFFPYCGEAAVFATGSTPDARLVDQRCVNHANVHPVSRVFLTVDGWVWLMSIVATAGLLGLGAPFWFNAFSTIAQMTGKVSMPRPKAEQLAAEPEKRELSKSSLARPGAEPSLDVQVDAFKINAGKLSATRIGEEISAALAADSGPLQGAVFVSASGAAAGAPGGGAGRPRTPVRRLLSRSNTR